MAFLRFEAEDSNGKRLHGTLQANSVQEVQQMLAARGLRAISIGDTAASQPAPNRTSTNRAAPSPISVPGVVATPAQRQPSPSRTQVESMRPAATAQNSVSKVTSPAMYTKRAYFIFTQWASLSNAGLGQSQMISGVKPSCMPKLQEALTEMEGEVASGLPLSDSMEKRPNTFDEAMVATVRVGEISGKMPVAFDKVAQTMLRARSFLMTLSYFFIMLPLLILCGVGGIGIQYASQGAMKRQWDADGKLPPGGTLLEEMGKFMPKYGGIALVVCALIFAIMIGLYRPRFRLLRHKLGLLVPMILPRAKNEAIERMSWALGELLKAGKSPAASIRLAAETIPNLELRRRAIATIDSVRENEALSQIVPRLGLFNYQYQTVIANGELVGNPSGALDTIVHAESQSYDVNTKSSRISISVGTTIIMAVFTVLMLLFLYKMYATNMVDMLNKAGETP